MAEANRERWLTRAYLFYRYFLETGLPDGPNQVMTLTFDIPNEISSLPTARRHRLSPYDVALWAYRNRHHDVGWSQLESELIDEYEGLIERSLEQTPKIQASLARLRAKPLADETLDEIFCQEAQLEFVSGPSRHDWKPRSAESIRKAVQRNVILWTIAEQAAAQASSSIRRI